MARIALWSRLLLPAAALALGGADAAAHEPGERAGQESAGSVHFAVSCSPAAQQQFDHAVAVLHSFWYEEAVKEFTAVGETDPTCAMAQWGVAMSHWYPLWYPPFERALTAGAAATEKAQALGAKTERERDYIAAIGTFYKDAQTLDHRTRALAYEKAMEQVHLRNPADSEAAVFYALALNATASPTDKTFANQRKAAAILEAVHAEQPTHPGVIHYLIHSYDSPPLAEAGLPAARAYAGIAPDVPHALHMPSHIFTRRGLWQESIDSNARSAAVGQAYAQENFGPGVAWDQSLHAMDYLEYAYLQTARDGAAKQVLDEINGFSKAQPASLASAYAVAIIPARYAVERRDWATAATLSLPPVALPWERFPWTEAMVVFARALGAAHTGDGAAAKTEIAKLEALRDRSTEAKNPYWAGQVEVQRLAASGVAAHAQGDDAQALELLGKAAELEATTDKSAVTPGAIVPSRELLADLLLELGRPADALRDYELTLATEPNRFRTLFGAAQAAEKVGDAAKAKRYYEALTAMTAKADTQRPELQLAAAFLAQAK
jgi:tetratricopeptide (TPR) repeat protein